MISHDFSSIKSPPKFDGLNFPIWKIKMNLFLKSLGVRVAKAITKEFVESHGDEETWSDATAKDYEANAKAQYALTQGLNGDDLSRVINCKSAFEVWNYLIITYEGTSQVKRSKIDLLCSQYENFYMLENDCIDDMLTRFTKITNGLSSWCDKIDNDQNIRKVIRAFPKSWEVKATTLEELNDREEMDFSGFIGNLKTYEMKMKVREEKEASKKKAVAFKATPYSFNEDESSKDGDEDFAMLIRKVSKMFYKKGRQNNFRRGRPQGRLEKEETRPCLSNSGLPLTTSHDIQERA